MNMQEANDMQAFLNTFDSFQDKVRGLVHDLEVQYQSFSTYDGTMGTVVSGNMGTSYDTLKSTFADWDRCVGSFFSENLMLVTRESISSP